MTVPTRSYSSPLYRYGFQGQEKDDEIKGAGNSINYKFRMYDPRIGRFLSIDPMLSEYPWNSTYAFAENKLGLGTELEGKELKYLNGELVYEVQSGQGPSQIAQDINLSENMKKFGYSGILSNWRDIVGANYEEFKSKGRYKDMKDIDDIGYTRLNINPGDILKVDFLHFKNEPIEKIKHVMPKATFATVGGSISVNAGLAETSVSYTSILVAKDDESWDRGRDLTLFSTAVSGDIKSPRNINFKKPGGDITPIMGGITTFSSAEGSSRAEQLQGFSIVTDATIIAPICIGGKLSTTVGDQYFTVIGGVAFGTPGVSVSNSPNSNVTHVHGGPKTHLDSLKVANQWLKDNPNANPPLEFLKKHGYLTEEFKD